MTKIIAASNNKNKIREIKAILADTGYEILSLADAGINIDPDENSDTFEGNALIKARAVAELVDFAVLADDSGLSVDCLGGGPGVHSKRFAGPDATDLDNNDYLVKKMQEKCCEDKNARFVCVIAFIDRDGKEYTFRGVCEGLIQYEAQGENGFGYDPHFYVTEYKKTMAQLDDEIKNKISHRGSALRKFRSFLERV